MLPVVVVVVDPVVAVLLVVAVDPIIAVLPVVTVDPDVFGTSTGPLPGTITQEYKVAL